jgi:hypothetical protein
MPSSLSPGITTKKKITKKQRKVVDNKNVFQDGLRALCTAVLAQALHGYDIQKAGRRYAPRG